MSYRKHNIWVLKLYNGNLRMNDKIRGDLVILSWRSWRSKERDTSRPIEAYIKAHSAHFRSDITVELDN